MRNRSLKFLCFLFASLLIPPLAFSQGGSISSGGILVLSPLGRPIGGATVTVCAFGATGIPCSPTITVYTDPTLVTPALNPATSDGNGSVFVYAAPGSYTYTVTGTGITGKAFTATVSGSGGGNVINGGPASFTTLTVSGTATLADATFLSHNSMPWSIAGTTPTIDQSITRCTTLSVSLACMPSISPGYTGAESTNLFTTSVGYQIYTGSAIITDYRNNVGTPGNGFNSPIYGIIYGGRLGGALNRLGISNYCHNVTDSCTGQNSWAFLDGTMPPVSNNGLQAGAINLLMMHDTLTLGGTASEVNGTDSEIHADATSTDNPILAASSYGGAVTISRTAGVQSVLVANVFRAKQHSNISSSGGKIFYAYGVRGDNQTIGLYRNYAASWQGNELYENATKIDAEDTGTLCTIANSPTGATESGQTVTITTTAPCTAAIAGAHFNISGVGVAGYNGDAILLTGSGGTTFTYYLPGTTNLAASGSGTATPHTPRTTTTFQANNIIDYRPLVDTIGWNWNTQAGTNIFKINSTGILAYQSIVPGSAGLINLGLASLPISQLVLGNVANQSVAFNPLSLAGNRTINIPDFGANGPTTQNQPFLTILTSQYTNSTTGFTNVAGGNTLQFPVLANITYTATCHLYYQAAATGGLNIEFTGPAAPTAVTYGLNLPVSATAQAGNGVATAYSSSLGAVVTTATTNFDAIVSFSLINGVNAGTVNLLAKSSAAVQLQIQAGSFCRIQ